jgi:hypothetical protein
MAVRVESAALVGLLADLVVTASPSKDFLPTSAILLHGDRGERLHEPGRVDLLVGTSLNRKVIGHTWAPADGLLPPMVWPVDDARTVLAALKMKITGEKDNGGPKHAVRIGRDGTSVEIVEDPAQRPLFEGDKPWQFSFHLANLDDFPRGVWDLLSSGDRHAQFPVRDGDGTVVEALPRTDFSPEHLAPFVSIAKRRGWEIQAYRTHHRRAVHVQIGFGYRGVIIPRPFDEEHESGVVPDARVYDPGLPPPPPPKPKPAPAGVSAPAGQPVEPAPVDLDMPEWNAKPDADLIDDEQLSIEDQGGES